MKMIWAHFVLNKRIIIKWLYDTVKNVNDLPTEYNFSDILIQKSREYFLNGNHTTFIVQQWEYSVGWNLWKNERAEVISKCGWEAEYGLEGTGRFVF